MRRLSHAMTPYFSDAAAFALLGVSLSIVALGISTASGTVQQTGQYQILTSSLVSG